MEKEKLYFQNKSDLAYYVFDELYAHEVLDLANSIKVKEGDEGKTLLDLIIENHDDIDFKDSTGEYIFYFD